MGRLLFILFLFGLTTESQGQISGYWTEKGEYEYFVPSWAYETWWVSATECHSLGADLVSFASEEEHLFIEDWLESIDEETTFWIGLTKYQDSDFKWSDGSDREYTRWSAGYPKEGQGDCVLQNNDDNLWYNENCGRGSYSYVCKRIINQTDPITTEKPSNVPGHCPLGYDSFGEKCFKVVILEEEEGLTWQEALATCRGGPGLYPDLASIHSEEESTYLLSQFQERTIGLWIGFHRDGTWVWSDNTYTDYANWGTGGSYSGDCAELWQEPGPPGTWGSIDCDRKRGYVCKTNKDPASVISTPGPTSPHSCPSGYTPYWYACYRLLSATNTWEASSLACQNDGATLVSIHSASENAYIQLMVQDIEYTWIGLRDTEGDGEYFWSDGWYVQYTSWAGGSPSPPVRGGCVAIDSHGEWTDIECDTQVQAICKYTTAPPLTEPPHVEGFCPEVPESQENKWVASGDMCFFFVVSRETALTWLQAMESCMMIDRNARLASIHHFPDNQVLFDLTWEKMDMSTVYQYDSVWLGMFRGKEGGFEWADQSVVQYSYFEVGEPSGPGDGNDCAYMHLEHDVDILEGKWATEQCTSRKPYICSVPKVPPPTTPAWVDGECPSEDWDHYGEICLLFEPNDAESWAEAAEICKLRGGDGASLVSVHEFHENEYIRSIMDEKNSLPSHRTYWLGMKTRNSTVWWHDSSEVDYENWSEAEPVYGTWEDRCVEASTETGRWSTDACSDHRGYVCSVNKLTGKEGGDDQKDQLSGGEIAGIVVGLVAGVILVAALIFFTMRSRFGSNSHENTPKTGLENRVYKKSESSSI